MPTYAFKGRNRLNENDRGRKGCRIAGRAACSAPPRTDHSHRRHREGPRFRDPKARTPQKGQGEGTRCIHATVLRDDRCGSALVQCLDILGEQQQNAFFKDVLRQVRQNVEEGSNPVRRDGEISKVFDSLFTSMVEAGETGGVLDLILQRLATLIEKVVKLKRSIVSASIYPAAVILVAIGAIALIMIVVIRSFSRSSLVYWDLASCCRSRRESSWE